MGRFITDHLLEFRSLRSRHAELAREMLRRGYRHQSPFKAPIRRLQADEAAAVIDRNASLAELMRRCPECRANFLRGLA